MKLFFKLFGLFISCVIYFFLRKSECVYVWIRKFSSRMLKAGSRINQPCRSTRNRKVVWLYSINYSIRGRNDGSFGVIERESHWEYKCLYQKRFSADWNYLVFCFVIFLLSVYATCLLFSFILLAKLDYFFWILKFNCRYILFCFVFSIRRFYWCHFC